jgi:RimJ/RimL family protein N-acetyltransferase
MNQTLQTKNLTLRRPVAGDAGRLAELLNNFNVAANLAQVSLPYTKADTALWLPQKIAARKPEDTGFVIEKEAKPVIGMVSFRKQTRDPVLGYWLGEEYWGRGIMGEAVTCALDWYFKHASNDMVLSGVFHFNVASLAIQRKLGFVETGRSMVRCLARNADIEHIDTKLTRQAFEAAIK